ncbi:globin C, coelomic-like [Gigantopelta aegis]|uniref:globin C, coelomic-like n=1 Tax=Gigantopelta aegis TaxID=1735272 RepID=UPI001B88D273|nr:globin C, coelomic-like [Gigantopelta aegis]XP_041351858.1 globin C, coelomic-like [Gigantopelta aegis]
MGCDLTKTTSVAVEETDAPEEVKKSGFTETQIDTIISTWPVLYRDPVRTGAQVFIRIFTDVPGLKKLFGQFGSYSVEELMELKSFRDHSRLFMEVIQTIVDNIETLPKETQNDIIALGASHATFHGFDKQYFRIYTKCLLEVWEQELGEEFIQEVRDCWLLVFEYLVDKMSEGFDLCHKDMDSDHFSGMLSDGMFSKEHQHQTCTT